VKSSPRKMIATGKRRKKKLPLPHGDREPGDAFHKRETFRPMRNPKEKKGRLAHLGKDGGGKK